MDERLLADPSNKGKKPPDQQAFGQIHPSRTTPLQPWKRGRLKATVCCADSHRPIRSPASPTNNTSAEPAVAPWRNSPTTNQQRLSGLDGVRACACFWVVAHHCFLGVKPQGNYGDLLLEVFSRGYNGLMIFFVLSGFLLSLPFLVAYRQGERFDWSVYAVRRLGRIVPGYYACLVISGFALGAFSSWKGLGDILLGMVFLNSFVPGSFFPVAGNPPLWSIGIEVGFYLLLPAFALVALRGSLWWARLVCLVTVAVIVASNAAMIEWVCPGGPPASWPMSHQWALTKNVFALLPHFLVGFLAADLYLAFSHARAPQGWTADLLVVGALVVGGVLASAQIDIGNTLLGPWNPASKLYTEYSFPWAPVGVGCLLILLPQTRLLGPRVLDHCVLRWMATLSFGIYLWHFPILHWLTKTLGPALSAPSMLSRLLLLGLTLLLATFISALSYWLIERPILRYARQYQPRQARKASRGNASPTFQTSVSPHKNPLLTTATSESWDASRPGGEPEPWSVPRPYTAKRFAQARVSAEAAGNATEEGIVAEVGEKSH